MKRAIVAGSSGFVGSALVRVLLEKGIHVLALGRKSFTNSPFCKLEGNSKLTYIEIDNAEISKLSSRLIKISWDVGKACVFYNFSWSGLASLTDGTFEEQFSNVTTSVAMVELASKLGCTKFVSVGTQEEKLMGHYLAQGWEKYPYQSSHDIYAVAKICSRDQSKLAAYLNRINFIHTTFSVPICEKLNGKGYPNSTLKSIYNNEEYIPPISNQLFDFIPLRELARAYFLIGAAVENKSEYFIGSGRPRTLGEYFSRFSAIIKGLNMTSPKQEYCASEFNTDHITDDLGFQLAYNFDDIAKKLERS